MKGFDTVIFDLDGTLLNTLDDLADSANHALSTHGLPERTVDQVRQFVGNGVAQLIHLAVPEGTPQDVETQCLTDFKAHYRANMRRKTAPYPGIPELLKQLQINGCKVAVVSNKFAGAVKELCGAYFGPLLPVALGERPGVQKKPAPDLVWACLKELEATAEGAVYVGDSDVDIETAKNAGLPCLSVSWGFRDRAFLLSHGAQFLADTPQELSNLLLGQTAG